MKLTSSTAITASLSVLVAGASVGCTGSDGTTTPSLQAPSSTSVPTTRPPAADETAPSERLWGAFGVVQLWPGTDQWPPSSLLGPQHWPTVAMTDAPTSTVDVIEVTATPESSTADADEVIVAVQAQVGVTEAAYEAAVRNPDDPSLRAGIEAATVEGSPARIEFISAYETIVAAGQRSVPDPDVPNSIELVTLPFIAEDALSATVVICHVSGDSLVDAAGQVLSDARNAWLIVEEFRSVDGAWMLFERQALGVTPEGTQCETDLLTGSLPPSSPSPG